MYTITSTIESLLKELASKLPALTVETHEKHLITGAEIISWNTITEIDGKPINPEEKYIWNYPVICYANHYRRLRRRYRKKGIEGVQDYLTYIDSLVKEKKISGTMKAIRKIIQTVATN